VLNLSFDSSQSLKPIRHISHTTPPPNTARHLSSPGPFFLHYPTRLAQIHRHQCSPLVTILALHHTHRPSSQGPDRTLPFSPFQRQRNRMSSPTASNGSASTVSSTAQSQYQDRLISKNMKIPHPTSKCKLGKENPTNPSFPAYCRQVSPRTPLSPNYQIISDRRGSSFAPVLPCSFLKLPDRPSLLLRR
jgi:hypothetical protein